MTALHRVARPEPDAARVEAARLREAIERAADLMGGDRTAFGAAGMALMNALAAPSASARDLSLLRLGEAALAYERARGTPGGAAARAAYLVALGEVPA